MFEQEIIDLFNENLNVAILESETLGEFLNSMLDYMKHSRKEDKVGGRTIGFMKENFVKLVNMLRALGCDDNEIIAIIAEIPSLMNVVDDVYKKILLLGVIDNECNVVRRAKLIHRPKDFMVGFKKMYARFKLIAESGYNRYTWNSLVHASEKEFASIFVYKVDGVQQLRKRADHQIFDSVEQVQEWLNKVDESEFDIEEFKMMDVNREFVFNYEQKGRRY